MNVTIVKYNLHFYLSFSISKLVSTIAQDLFRLVANTSTILYSTDKIRHSELFPRRFFSLLPTTKACSSFTLPAVGPTQSTIESLPYCLLTFFFFLIILIFLISKVLFVLRTLASLDSDSLPWLQAGVRIWLYFF